MSKRKITIDKRKRVRLGIVDGDLKIGKGAKLIAEKDTIVVHGKIRNKGGFICKGNLEARSIDSRDGKVNALPLFRRRIFR